MSLGQIAPRSALQTPAAETQPQTGHSKVKAITQDHLDNQMISAPGHPDSNAEIKLPMVPEIQINRREELLLLISEGVKAS